MTAIPSLLLVDDDVDFAESLGDVLGGHGYRVTLAHSGEEALERNAEQAFDLVLLDMKMPGMDGLECLTELRRLRPGIQVVIVTAFTRGELIGRALEGGAVAVLYKPVAVEELLRAIAFIALPASMLLVEDDADLAEVLQGVLSNAGYRVRSVGTLAAAREALIREPVRLVLLDYRLPDGPGTELVDWIKAQSRDEAIVLLTAYPDLVLNDLACLSANDILVKPFPPDRLIKELARRMQAKKPESTVAKKEPRT